MANKFVSSTGPIGTGDGSSEANAWSLANALSSAAAGDYVWIKNNGVYTGNFTVNCNGSNTANTHIFFIGYNDLNNCDLINHISDMDFGRAFWGGPIKPNAENCWVDVNGGGNSADVVYQNAKNNIHWRNIYFHNVNMVGVYCAYNMKNSQNCSFTKCKFEHSNINLWIDSNSTNCLIKYCYFNDCSGQNLDLGGGSYLNTFSHCVFNGGKVKMYRSIGCHSIFIGGTYGIGAYYYQNLVFNNVMYNQTSYCLAYGHNSYVGGLIEYNNIFIPATKNIPAIFRNGNGSITFSGFGCAYCINDNSILDVPYSGQNGLNVNPQFADAANNDFRSRNPLVLRGGMPNLSDNTTQIGAIMQKYQFANRGQYANPGRISIFK